MSGFSYPDWIGDVYPPGTKRDGMLAEYAKIFPSVEINMSFRRTPVPKTIDRWREAVPPEFRFTMKAHQRITHWKKLIDTSDDVAMFVKESQGLGPRLGLVLFQVPPTLQFDAAVLGDFCGALPPGCVYAFEPRNDTFLTEAALDVLHSNGVALCLNDDLFEPARYRVTGPVAYFRFHRDGYSPDDLAARKDQLSEIEASGTDVYAFFAHEDNPESVRPALDFQKLLS
jgi:uncharacterized protein YecE (DUF72 family)